MDRVFLSHTHNFSSLVVAVAALLQKCVPGGVYCYETTIAGDYPGELAIEIDRCTHMVVFIGGDYSEHVTNEVHSFYAKQHNMNFWRIVDCREDDNGNLPQEFAILNHATRIDVDLSQPGRSAAKVARDLAAGFIFDWRGADGLPANPHLFSYEKDIIKFYKERVPAYSQITDPTQYNDRDPATRKKLRQTRKKLLDGAPQEWPSVHEGRPHNGGVETQNSDSLRKIVGEWQAKETRVAAAALLGIANSDLSFPEARPRQYHVFPRQEGGALEVSILVSGGIAPGINSVIDGITNRHFLYADHNHYPVHVRGLLDGFRAFSAGADSNTIDLFPDDRHGGENQNSLVTAQHVSEGGSMLGTSRVGELVDPDERMSFLEEIVGQLFRRRVDILYIIGGDGSMKAAHAIRNHSMDYAERHRRYKDRKISVVGVPKTMDNDILWVWQSFGFLSAVEKAREVIETLSTEVDSNPRLCVIQLFGSDSGFVVSHAVLASRGGMCDAALIPEVPFSMEKLAKWVMKQMISRNRRIPSSMIVMAETAIPTDAMDFIEDSDIGLSGDEKKALEDFEELRESHGRIEGQANDNLRRAGLKIVSKGLEKIIKSGTVKIDTGQSAHPNWKLLRVFTNEPRQLLRAIPPSCVDIIFGQRLGTLAVDNALAGYSDFMISQWLTEYVLVPLDLVVLGRKRIPEKGVFWRSVRAKTGQPDLG